MLLAEFHNILPGTVIDDGEQDGTEMLAMVSRIIKDYRSDAFLYLAIGDKPAENGEFPIFVFNYLPYEITTPMTSFLLRIRTGARNSNMFCTFS